MELRRTIHSPTTMPTTWPSTVARAAPATSIRGKGPMPKMSNGSRIMLQTEPSDSPAIVIFMQPTA